MVRKSDAVISSPKIIRRNRTDDRHIGTVISESFADNFTEEVNFIEQDSFMVKSEAWVFFHDNLLIDIQDSDHGPDCFWCKIFRIKYFGKIPCLRSLHYGLIHLGTNSLDSALPYDVRHSNRHKTLERYEEKTKLMYNLTILTGPGSCIREPIKEPYASVEEYL